MLSCVQLFENPCTVALQIPLSMGFPRQEYLRGLPFPPPGDLSDPGIEPKYPALHVNSLPSEPPGKPRNAGVGSLSLLQGNFLTQESNPGLQHCGRILYQLNYPGSPLLMHRDYIYVHSFYSSVLSIMLIIDDLPVLVI